MKTRNEQPEASVSSGSIDLEALRAKVERLRQDIRNSADPTLTYPRVHFNTLIDWSERLTGVLAALASLGERPSNREADLERQIDVLRDMHKAAAQEIQRLSASLGERRGTQEEEKNDLTRVESVESHATVPATAGANEAIRSALRKLVRGIPMLGVMPSEHPQSVTYNEALKLAASYVASFIGREGNLSPAPPQEQP